MGKIILLVSTLALASMAHDDPYLTSKQLRVKTRSILEFKLRLSAVFLSLLLHIPPDRFLIYTNC